MPAQLQLLEPEQLPPLEPRLRLKTCKLKKSPNTKNIITITIQNLDETDNGNSGFQIKSTFAVAYIIIPDYCNRYYYDYYEGFQDHEELLRNKLYYQYYYY